MRPAENWFSAFKAAIDTASSTHQSGSWYPGKCNLCHDTTLVSSNSNEHSSMDLIGPASQMMAQVLLVPKEAQMMVLNAIWHLHMGVWLYLDTHTGSPRWDSESPWSIWVVKANTGKWLPYKKASCHGEALLAGPTAPPPQACLSVRDIMHLRRWLWWGITALENL